MTSPWSYIFTDIRSGRIIEQLPLYGVDCYTTFNAAGTFKGSLNIGDRQVLNDGTILRSAQGLNWRECIAEGRVALYVDLNGRIVWAGIVWQTDYYDDRNELIIQANEFMSYYQARLILTTNAGNPAWTAPGVDQTKMVRDIVAYTQRDANTLPIIVTGPTATVTRQLKINAYDMKKASDVIDQLMQLADGIDYNTSAQWVNGRPQNFLNLYYPQVGRTAAASGLVFEKPGNITKYRWPRDGTLGPVTDMVETGAGTGATMVFTHVVNQPLLDAGYPHLFSYVARKDIPWSAVLANYALADLARLTEPVSLPLINIRISTASGETGDPVLGSWQEGDWCRVRILDERFPAPGLDQNLRITRTQMKPGDDGNDDCILTLSTV